MNPNRRTPGVQPRQNMANAPGRMPGVAPQGMHAVQQALALYQQGRVRAAARLLQPIIDKPPSRQAEQKASHLMGACLVREVMYDKAAEHLKRAARLAPTEPQVKYDWAQALYFAGRYDECESAVKSALAVNPNHPESVALLAAVHQAHGDHERAVEMLDAARARGVDHPALAIALAGSATRVGREADALEQLGRFANNQRIQAPHRQEMLYQAAAILEKAGQTDEAFKTYEGANRLLPVRYDPKNTERLVDEIIEGWTPERMRAMARGRDESRKPVFVVGMPRSGTTLIENILDAHPDVHAAGELMNIPMIYGAMFPPNRSLADSFKAFGEKQAAAASSEYLNVLGAIAPDAARVIDKHPLNFMHLGLIAALFPGARIIHSVRDPRDTCLSCYFRNFLIGFEWATDQRWVAAFYRQYLRLMEHWERAIPEAGLAFHMTEVRYEQVIEDQEQASRDLLGFIGLDWSEEVLRFHERNRPARTLLVDQVGKPVYKTSVAKWKKYEKHIGPLLEALAPVLEDSQAP